MKLIKVTIKEENTVFDTPRGDTPMSQNNTCLSTDGLKITLSCKNTNPFIKTGDGVLFVGSKDKGVFEAQYAYNLTTKEYGSEKEGLFGIIATLPILLLVLPFTLIKLFSLASSLTFSYELLLFLVVNIFLIYIFISKAKEYLNTKKAKRLIARYLREHQ